MIGKANVFWLSAGLVCAFAAGPRIGVAQPAPPAAKAAAARQFLTACMNHEMSVSRTISYNEAGKLCKSRLRAKDALLAAGTGPKTAGTLPH